MFPMEFSIFYALSSVVQSVYKVMTPNSEKNALKISIKTVKIFQNGSLGRWHTAANECFTLGRHPGCPITSESKSLVPILRFYGGAPWGLFSLWRTGKIPPRLDRDYKEVRNHYDVVGGQIVVDYSYMAFV